MQIEYKKVCAMNKKNLEFVTKKLQTHVNNGLICPLYVIKTQINGNKKSLL